MPKSLQMAIKRVLTCGIHDTHDSFTQQRVMVANLFSMIGYSITFTLSLAALISENTMLSFSLFLAGIIFAFAHLFNGLGNRKDSYKISAVIVQVCLMALMVYLVYSGGKGNTGPLWIYIVPPVVFFFGGLKIGGINLAVFIVIISLMLFYPLDSILATSYTFEFASRTLFSFMTVSLLFGFYEYSRQHAINSIQYLSKQYEKQAMTDPLTQIPNRRGMKEHLEHEYARSTRNQRNACVMLCDVDYFKSINDKYGHEAGDYVLIVLSKLLSDNVRIHDKCARWGGEEFLILLPETSKREAYQLAERLRIAVENMTVRFKSHNISMQISIGLAEMAPSLSIDAAINEADKHLFMAKDQGRNRVSPAIL